MSIPAIIVNRNLLSTLISTIDFLSKESRVEIIIYDQDSTYPPLLEYYKTCPYKIIKSKNLGPHSVWGNLKEYLQDYFIITDSDCTYDGIPEDWLDTLFITVNNTNEKAGFSLNLDFPISTLKEDVCTWEAKFWKFKNEYGWIADIDTTFALYPPKSPFKYTATRLDKPYCAIHVPWTLNKDKLSEEWFYYINHVSGISTWGNKLK